LFLARKRTACLGEIFHLELAGKAGLIEIQTTQDAIVKL
jgi:hypothetical protein